MSESTLIGYEGLMDRQQLALVPTPLGTSTHRPIPHVDVINALTETLGFRHITVHKEQFAVSKDGNRMFGVMELDQGMHGIRFALGVRNANDKAFRLAVTVGYRVAVCENLMFAGEYTPLLAKHSKNFRLIEAISVGVDDCQRNFKPLQERVERWQATQITDVTARLTIYQAFIEAELDAPKHLARSVHDYFFNPPHPEFAPRTAFSLENAFTGAFKELDPIPLHRATGSLATFLSKRPFG